MIPPAETVETTSSGTFGLSLMSVGQTLMKKWLVPNSDVQNCRKSDQSTSVWTSHTTVPRESSLKHHSGFV